MFDHEGFVVMPALPIKNMRKQRREAWAKVKSAGLKIKHPYMHNERPQAEVAAAACTKAAGVQFKVSECIY